jgi:agmatinase
VFIGGEHSVTQGLIPPFQKKYKGLSILHFDAHADLRPEYEGSPHNHASALYPVSRKTKTVQVGIRSVSHDEKHYINSGKVRTFLMHENLNLAKLEKDVLKALSDTVYLTIDIDGFDPSVMPGTGTPQPGGFLWYDALKLFKAVCKKKKVVGIDVVEVSPIKGSPLTEFNAAKLVHRLMGYLS